MSILPSIWAQYVKRNGIVVAMAFQCQNLCDSFFDKDNLQKPTLVVPEKKSSMCCTTCNCYLTNPYYTQFFSFLQHLFICDYITMSLSFLLYSSFSSWAIGCESVQYMMLYVIFSSDRFLLQICNSTPLSGLESPRPALPVHGWSIYVDPNTASSSLKNY